MSPEAAGVPAQLRQQLLQMAAYIRNPAQHPAPPGIEERRLRIYRELFFNNIHSLLSGMFPVICSLYSDAQWSAMVRDFYQHHRCETPYFPSIAEEFIAWLRDEKSLPADKPFLLELAHYEWVELALATSEDNLARHGLDPDGDLLAGVPVVSPLCWPLGYRFPVHRIGVNYQPVTAPEQATCLLVYRNADDKVCFVESSPASIQLMEFLQKNDTQNANMRLTGEQVLYSLAQELQHLSPHAVLQFGRELLLTWHRLGIIPGVLRHQS